MTQEALKLALEATQPEQEPVAWMHTKIDGVAVPHRPADLDKHPERWTALYKDPKPCPTCEALARTVMLDQTSHDSSPPQRTEQEPVGRLAKFTDGIWRLVTDYSADVPLYTHPPQRRWVGLTDEEENEYNYLGPDMYWVIQEISAILKEKNT